MPTIATIITPRILDFISAHIKSTPEKEREKLERLLSNLSDEITDLVSKKTKKKHEIVEKIYGLIDKLGSQEYQQTLRPDVANVVKNTLLYTTKQKRAHMIVTLRELRELVNTWIHDVRFAWGLHVT